MISVVLGWLDSGNGILQGWRTNQSLNDINPIKKLFIIAAFAVSTALLLNGCIAIGTGPKSQHINATLGQQLVDLKTAKDTGAITEAEYETQKAKLLGEEK